MHRIPKIPVVFLALSLGFPTAAIQAKNPPAQPAAGPAVLWREPADIASRDLYYGPGGKEHAPHGTFTFEKEDLQNANPKFDVVDEDGVKWRVKLGDEARPETAATRLLWAVGYFANEDYFLPEIHVKNLPRLHRGSQYVSPEGAVRNARLKRRLKDEKKIGFWKWANNPFKDTREWYGLRVMMAVISNWDLKDVNNSIYQVTGGDPEQRYVVTDVGASLGGPSFNFTQRGNLKAYRESKFLSGVSHGFVSFNVTSWPALNHWITQRIPVEHAKWVGGLLARLSPGQIQDAFRAAGFPHAEAEGFTEVVRGRIAELEALH